MKSAGVHLSLCLLTTTVPMRLLPFLQSCYCLIQAVVFALVIAQVITYQHWRIVMQIVNVLPRVVVWLETVPPNPQLQCPIVIASPLLE